jgi:hypothetical protein
MACITFFRSTHTHGCQVLEAQGNRVYLFGFEFLIRLQQGLPSRGNHSARYRHGLFTSFNWSMFGRFLSFFFFPMAAHVSKAVQSTGGMKWDGMGTTTWCCYSGVMGVINDMRTWSGSGYFCNWDTTHRHGWILVVGLCEVPIVEVLLTIEGAFCSFF